MSTSYKDLKIYKEGLRLFIISYKMSMKLPKYEMYELGSQIRRASDSIVSNIVEGYGRKRYRAEFERFLIFSHASSIELQCHMEKIIVLHPDLAEEATRLLKSYERLGKMIYSYLTYVESSWIVK